MINCPICRIQFGGQYDVCPKCSQFKPSFKDRRLWLKHRAEEALRNGDSVQSVQDALVEEGFNILEAEVIVQELRPKVASSARATGWSWIFGGIGMVFLTLLASVVHPPSALLLIGSLYMIGRGIRAIIRGVED